MWFLLVPNLGIQLFYCFYVFLFNQWHLTEHISTWFLRYFTSNLSIILWSFFEYEVCRMIHCGHRSIFHRMSQIFLMCRSFNQVSAFYSLILNARFIPCKFIGQLILCLHLCGPTRHLWIYSLVGGLIVLWSLYSTVPDSILLHS